MLDIQNKFAILVVSCDKYSDLWSPFFKSFFRFWPDCPFNIYLLSNYKFVDIPQVRNLLIGDDISWSDNLYKALNHLEEDYIFLFLDDLFLLNFVKTDEVLRLFTWIIEANANYVRMNPSPKPDKRYNELVGTVSKGTIYRTSTVLSIWKKDVLLNLLKSGESAWDFEVFGSIRSDKYEYFYSTWRKYFSIINGVIKGKWQKSTVKILKSLGIEVDLNKRQIMNLEETIVFYFQKIKSRAFNMIVSPKHRRKLKKIILRGKYNYKIKL